MPAWLRQSVCRVPKVLAEAMRVLINAVRVMYVEALRGLTEAAIMLLEAVRVLVKSRNEPRPRLFLKRL